MAIHPMLFGWRVRGWDGAGWDGYVHLDWCGGNDQKDVERLYSVMYNILSNREEDSALAFDGVPPHSDIKPFYNDENFIREISSLIVEPFSLLELPDLGILRTQATLHMKKEWLGV